jgi:hypothetical protein
MILSLFVIQRASSPLLAFFLIEFFPTQPVFILFPSFLSSIALLVSCLAQSSAIIQLTSFLIRSFVAKLTQVLSTQPSVSLQSLKASSTTHLSSLESRHASI